MRRHGVALSVLLTLGLGSLGTMAGCEGIPAVVAKGVADVRSNTKTTGADFNRVLDGYVPTNEEKAHMKARVSAEDDLLESVDTWVQNHKKE